MSSPQVDRLFLLLLLSHTCMFVCITVLIVACKSSTFLSKQISENNRNNPVSNADKCKSFLNQSVRDGLCTVAYWKVSAFQWCKILKILVYWEILVLIYPISYWLKTEIQRNNSLAISEKTKQSKGHFLCAILSCLLSCWSQLAPKEVRGRLE